MSSGLTSNGLTSSGEPATGASAHEGYVVLARKWRPQTFADLVGQDHVALTLANSIRMNRVAHAFLFTGVRGVGKTTSARILAKALNCEQGPTHTPCLSCAPCREIGLGSDMDVLEMDAATRTGVDDVRQLQESLPYRPARDRYKVLIIDEVHMLSSNAWNALLKTLEEPPPHVKIIFATTEVGKIPVTILSRCQRYDFKLISSAMIAARLEHVLGAEKIAHEPGATSLIAREAAGSMRDAMSLLDQVIAAAGEGQAITPQIVSQALGIAESSAVHRIVEAVAQREPKACLTIVAELSDSGFDMAHVTREVLATLRDVIVVSVAPEARSLVDVPDAEHAGLRKLAELATGAEFGRLYSAFSKSAEEILRSPSARASLEMALVRLATRPALIPMDDLVRRLESLERSLMSAGGDPGRAAGGGAPDRASGREARSAPRGREALPSDDPEPPVTQPSPMAGGLGGPAGRSAEHEAARSPRVELPYGVAPRQVVEDPVFAMPASVRRNSERAAVEAEVAPALPAPSSGPPPSHASPPSHAPASRPPPSAPPKEATGARRPVLDDPLHPAFADLEKIVLALRPKSPRVASMLERVAVIEIDDGVVHVGVEPKSFEHDTFSEPAAMAALVEATREVLGGEAQVSLEEVSGGRRARTLAKNYDEATRKRYEAAVLAVRTHPLVAAMVSELGAEIREVKVPDEVPADPRH